MLIMYISHVAIYVTGNTRWVEVNKQDVGRLKTVMSGGEVTILASLKQKKQNRGTIISFGTNRHR